MNILARTLVPLTAAITLTLSGCADDDGDSKASAAARSDDAPSVVDPSGTTAAPTPLPITDHVLPANALPGFAPQGRPVEEGLEAFAEAHEKDVAELRRSGFEVGTSLFFSGKGQDFAASVAVAYTDEAAADAEADRLFTSNTEGDPAITVTPLEVPGIPGVKAAFLDGADGGTQYAGVEIVFVDGSVLHELFAVGEADRFDVDAVITAVTALYERVAGHPTT